MPHALPRFRERRRGRFYDDPRQMPSAAPAPLEAPTVDPSSETTTEVKQRAARRKDERSAPEVSKPLSKRRSRPNVAGLVPPLFMVLGAGNGVAHPSRGGTPRRFLTEVSP